MYLPAALVLATFASLAASQCSYCGPFPVTADTLPSYVGPNPFPFAASTGYVQVDPVYDRNTFYWLVESSSPTAATDPLVFWFQGGPGCSGLAGLFTEHGPFYVNRAGNVNLREFTWNEYANVVYLEQPCGVGFSFSTEYKSQYPSSDDQAAQDNFNFIEGFLKANPRFSSNKIWLAGESYGGVYIPTVTGKILDNPTSHAYKNLAGEMLGNPVMSCESLVELNVLMNIFYWHQLISQRTYSQWNKLNCPSNPSSLRCTTVFLEAFHQIGQIDQEIGAFSFNGTQPSLDPDDLYQDFILGNSTLQWVTTLQTDRSITLDELAVEYLNRKDVQQAIHSQPPPAGEWDICVSGKTLKYNMSGESMIPFYQRLIKERPDVAILVYSGDIDIATVPAAQTMECLVELDGTPVDGREWGPWFVNGATAGYVETYKEYTYATVKGAGHTVPTYQPLSSLNLFRRFLQNQNLDGGEVYFTGPAKPRRRILRQSDMLRLHGVLNRP